MYRLALHLGYASPTLMLEEITPQQFMEWMAYSQIEPFQDVRSDYHAALIAKVQADIARDPKKRPQPFKIEDFILKFGSPKQQPLAPAPTRNQTLEQQKRAILMLAGLTKMPERKT